MTKTPLILNTDKCMPIFLILQNLIDDFLANNSLHWINLDESIHSPFNQNNSQSLIKEFDLCISGESLELLILSKMRRIGEFLKQVKVFARTSPDQKVTICF